MSHKGIGKGLDPKLLVVALGLVAIGAAGAYVGLFTNHGMRIGVIPVPLSIIGPLIAALGLGVFAFAFRQDKCLDCNAPLDTALVAFPIDAESHVLSAAQSMAADSLRALPLGSHGGPNIQVSFDACPKCRAIGVLDIDAFRPNRAPIVSKRVITGAQVGPWFDVLMQKAEEQQPADD